MREVASAAGLRVKRAWRTGTSYVVHDKWGSYALEATKARRFGQNPNAVKRRVNINRLAGRPGQTAAEPTPVGETPEPTATSRPECLQQSGSLCIFVLIPTGSLGRL